MAIDPNIKKKADDIRTKIKGEEVRESLASGLEAMSSDVVETVGRQDEVEGQFQNVIENTTDKDVISAPEIIAARDGEANLKARLDKEKNEVTSQLAQNAKLAYDIKSFGAKGDGVTDDSNAFKTALDTIPEDSTLYIPNGHYKLTSWNVYTINKNVKILGQSGQEVIIEGNSLNDLFIINADFRLENTTLKEWKTIFKGESNTNLNYFVLKGNIIQNNDTVISWNNNIETKIKDFVIEKNDFINIYEYVLMGDFRYDLLKITHNKVNNIVRYFIRVLGQHQDEDKTVLLAEHNEIKNITNGRHTGAAGVARAFQVRSIETYIRFNTFKEIKVDSTSTGNSTVLYHSSKVILVEGNTIIDCGESGGSGVLFDDKGAQTIKAHYINNHFIENEGVNAQKNIIGVRGANTLIQGNVFEGITGSGVYVGYADTTNVQVKNNIFLNSKCNHVIRVLGYSDGVYIESNIFDGVTSPGGVGGAVPGTHAILFEVSAGNMGAKNILIKSNSFKNITTTGERGDGTAIMISPIINHLYENIVIDGNLFNSVPVAVHLRNAGTVNDVFFINNTLKNITVKTVTNEIGSRLTNFVEKNNYGHFPPITV